MSWNRPTTTKIEDIADFLREKDNVSLIKLQDASTVTALKDPVTFINNRQTAIDEIYKKEGTMVTTYKQAYDRYITLKLPPQEAHELAYEASSATKTADFKALEMVYPGGYEKAIQVAKTTHNTTLATANTADTELVKQAVKGNDHYQIKYKATRKKYKATKKELKSKST